VSIIGIFKNPYYRHFIISETNFYSFAADGLLAQIEKQSHYDLSFKEIDTLKEKVEKQKSHALALKMLGKQTYTIEQIAELTGLNKKEIENLKK